MAENDETAANLQLPPKRKHNFSELPPGIRARSARIIVAAYRQMLITVLSALILLIILLLVMIFAGAKFGDKTDPAPSIALSVIVCGTLGAMFSAATRLYTFRDLPAAIVDTATVKLGNFYIFAYSLLPILIGAISAAVVYVLFLSGLLKGSLFPAFGCHIASCQTFSDLIWRFGPQTSEDFAKCLIWGFIAGFAERLVPDALQRLAVKAGNTLESEPSVNPDS